MLGQLNEPDQKEKVIYYLSKKFTSCEINYITIEKTCYALAKASYHTVICRMDPIKYIFEKLALIGKISRWQMLLTEFEIMFVTWKAIKG